MSIIFNLETRFKDEPTIDANQKVDDDTSLAEIGMAIVEIEKFKNMLLDFADEIPSDIEIKKDKK